MAQFEHLGHRIGPAEVQEEHARGQPHQATDKEPIRGTKPDVQQAYQWTWEGLDPL